MSESLVNKYINELATANHQKFVAQDENDTLRNIIAEKDRQIESLKRTIAESDKAIEGRVV